MPKINTRKIPGYDDMTTEEKLSALENTEIPAYSNDEVIDLRRKLSLAYAEIETNKKAKEDAGETWMPTIQHYPPEIQSRLDNMNEIVEVGKEALELENCGFDYASALLLAEATHAGDFDKAARIMQAHENNERTAHAAKIKETKETAALRKAFGLR